MNTIIRAQAAPWHRGVELYVCDAERRVRVVDIVMQKIEPEGTCVQEAAPFVLSNDAAQTLIDDLWAAGLRPTEGTGSAGAMKATENHLADLRTVLFHTMNIPKK